MAQRSPSVDELQRLVEDVQHVSKSYDPNADVSTSYGQRAAIRAAATQLLQAVTDPDDMVWKQVLHMTELVALRTAHRLGIFAAVPVGGSISKSDLADKVNATESLIERQMRGLVGTGFFGQTDDGDYKHTKFSESFIDTTKPGPGTFFQAMFDVYLSPTLHFDQYMVDNKPESGRYEAPRSNFHNPVVQYYGKDGQSVWDVMASIPEVMRTFQISLQAVDQIVPPVGPFYDFSQFKATGADDQQIQIVDVGGGYGKVLREIISATPDLDPSKCVLQDVQNVIGMASEAKQAGVQTMVIDFHKEQPVTGKEDMMSERVIEPPCLVITNPAIIPVLAHYGTEQSWKRS